MKHLTHVGYGGNVGDPRQTFVRAVEMLIHSLGPVVHCSSLYETKALTLPGAAAQDNYINAVVAFETGRRTPHDILEILLATEAALGRERATGTRWAPRPIDLDLLFVGAAIEQSASLTLPHPALHTRDFVLVPLCEVAPDLRHPVLGCTIRELEGSLESRGHTRFVLGKAQDSVTMPI